MSNDEEEEISLACWVCGDVGDYYMVRNHTWAVAGLHPHALCCLACLQRRLGRPLSIDDFTVCRLNRVAFAAAGRLDEMLEHERQRDEEEQRQREQFHVQWQQVDAQRAARRAQREWAKTAQTTLF